jgi:putative endopeptidase
MSTIDTSITRMLLATLLLSMAACSPGGADDVRDSSGGDAAPAADEARATIGAWGIDLEAREESVHPGDDFTRYANGAWLDGFRIPPDLSRYGVFVQLSLEAEDDVRAIVEELAAAEPAPGTLEQKVGDFYGAWMDVEQIEALGAAPLEPALASIAAIENAGDLMRAFSSLHLAAPFELGIIPDPADTTRYVAFMAQSGLGLPDRDYYLQDAEQFERYRAAYRAYMTRIFELIGNERPEQSADAVIALETQLAEVHWSQEDSRDIQKIYNPMSPGEVAALAPQFDWRLIFDEHGLGGVGTFVVAETTAIQGAGALLDETPIELWRDYLAFHLVRSHARYLSRAFDEAHFEFYSRTLQGVEEQRERWKRGVELVNAGLGEAVGQIYVDRHFPPTHRAEMEALVDNLIDAFGGRLRENEWMDQETRERALAKLATFEARIGYPDKWTDYGPLVIEEGQLVANAMAVREFLWQEELDRLDGPVDRDLWPYPPQTVNASYNPLLNQITFPAGILQPPFFDPYADPAVNYGAIGAVIGHEIGHGFDDQGRRFDEQGRIRDWWTPTADERFAERAERLGSQYDAYEPLPGMNISGQLTMGENIGDLGGMQMAYTAYRRHLAENGLDDAPVLDGLTGDQRFFLSWGQVWRSLTREDETRRRLVTDPHSPPDYRVNGVVRNMDEWYEAFGVTEHHELYLPPDERVRIW